MDGNLTWLVLLAVGSIYHPLHHLLPCAHIPTPATPAAPPFPLASSCLRRPDTPATRPPSCQPTSTPALHRRTRWPPLPRRRPSRVTACAYAAASFAQAGSPAIVPRGRPPPATLPPWHRAAAHHSELVRTTPSIAWSPKNLVSYGKSWLNPSESKLRCVEVNPIKHSSSQIHIKDNRNRISLHWN
jgi:hypothetical protein